jgi:hypothetical protein
LLTELVGTVVPGDTVRRITEEAGEALAALESREVEREPSLAERLKRPVAVVDAAQQVSVDGAMVPLVSGEWAEVKTVAIGRVIATGGGVKAKDLTYFSRLTDAATFTRLARLEFERRQTEEARVVVAVNDGAEWIGRFLDERCPDAVRVLDWAHAAGALGEAGQALFGPGTADCSAWVGTQMKRLWAGDTAAVIAELARAEAASGSEVVRGSRQYLEKRVDQLRYAVFRRRGYPVGSGIVESANKLVVEARLKRAGMHWARHNVDPVLALRCATASRRWRALWPAIVTRLRPPRHTPRPAQGATAEDSPPPTTPSPKSTPRRTPTIVNGRPTAAHPWKRAPSCRAK